MLTIRLAASVIALAGQGWALLEGVGGKLACKANQPSPAFFPRPSRPPAKQSVSMGISGAAPRLL